MGTPVLLGSDSEKSLFDRSNRDSILNRVPDHIGAKIYRLWQDRQDLFRLHEHDLKKECHPTPTHNRLRLSFWAEYDYACSGNRQMSMPRVYGGVVTEEYFNGHFMNHPTCVAWMLCPPANYEKAQLEMLQTAHSKLREVLDHPLVDSKTGKLDIKLAELVLKIVVATESRVFGSVVERQEHLVANISPQQKHAEGFAKGDLERLATETNMSQIEEKLKRLGLAKQKLSAVLDVEPDTNNKE